MNTFQAGRLRHRVSLQRNQPTQDPVTGEIKDKWVEYVKSYAAIEPLSARDFIAAQAGQSQVSARIVMRWRSDLLPTDRIVHGGTAYKIVGILPDKDSGREYVTIPVSTGARVI